MSSLSPSDLPRAHRLVWFVVVMGLSGYIHWQCLGTCGMAVGNAPVRSASLLDKLHLCTREEVHQISPHLTMMDEDVLTIERGPHAVDNGDGTVPHSYRGGPLRGFALFVSEDFHPSSATVDGVVVNAWYLPGDEETGEGILQYAADAVGVFDERFGPYPYAELDVVVIPDTRLPADMVTGVEYPTLVAVLHGGAGDPEFATVHEVAHQWWYGVVGNDVLQEPWLDESFANYSTIVYYEDVHGQEEAQRAYQERIGSRYEQIRGSEQDGPVGRSIQDFAESNQPSGPIIYGKGAVFLDTLRHEVGDEAFFAILREYFRRYKYGRATGDGFLKVAEEVVGAELDPLYDAWIRK